MPAELLLYPKAPVENVQRLVQAYQRMLESGGVEKDALFRWVVGAPRLDRPLFTWMLTHDGEPVGEVSLFNVDRIRAEVGVVMTPKCPKWLGASTFMNVCHFAYSTLGVFRLEAQVRVSNSKVVKLAKRFGFKQEGALRHAAPTVNGKLEDVAIFGLLKPEFYSKWGERSGRSDHRALTAVSGVRGVEPVPNGETPARVPGAAGTRSGNQPRRGSEVQRAGEPARVDGQA